MKFKKLLKIAKKIRERQEHGIMSDRRHHADTISRIHRLEQVVKDTQDMVRDVLDEVVQDTVDSESEPLVKPIDPLDPVLEPVAPLAFQEVQMKPETFDELHSVIATIAAGGTISGDRLPVDVLDVIKAADEALTDMRFGDEIKALRDAADLGYPHPDTVDWEDANDHADNVGKD
ncbi:hypothetical protein BI084_gp69 [Gordonia phage Terapin]|uniref:Uncharacterized protein n=5 Tax=Terapinvirus terapin TaxID=2734283 RepID=A0A345MBA8_9CAUD|nr:hypothetical protein BI084_gp69 [Gordonia phage Terapin]AVP43345.1 hypothetical protein PBI_DJOKOVIC_68 [Gordonia phage Djokovic]AXH67779.1 hypothetical protein SEA_BEYONCAGE_68 [Gordonia phage Beyoncage]QOC56213.1 hypothetical protein SEA_SIENNA_68 [Gordonia phage Sienna]QOC56638.1 hypothetical protein SEA_BITESIZE_68 [Gordonia phage BiteSize]QYW00870.1 hypothetical protein SEA_MADI_67 [Gordonia phage Madi]